MDPTLPPPVEEIIATLADEDQPLVMTELAELSGLTTAELGLFTDTWATISPDRRRKIIIRLVEMAEDNLKLDFNGIYKFCLDDPDDNLFPVDHFAHLRANFVLPVVVFVNRRILLLALFLILEPPYPKI